MKQQYIQRDAAREVICTVGSAVIRYVYPPFSKICDRKGSLYSCKTVLLWQYWSFEHQNRAHRNAAITAAVEVRLMCSYVVVHYTVMQHRDSATVYTILSYQRLLRFAFCANLLLLLLLLLL